MPDVQEEPYVLDLTAEQRQALEDRARRYPLPYREVVRAKVFGRCEPTTGIEPFGRLVSRS